MITKYYCIGTKFVSIILERLESTSTCNHCIKVSGDKL